MKTNIGEIEEKKSIEFRIELVPFLTRDKSEAISIKMIIFIPTLLILAAVRILFTVKKTAKRKLIEVKGVSTIKYVNNLLKNDFFNEAPAKNRQKITLIYIRRSAINPHFC